MYSEDIVVVGQQKEMGEEGGSEKMGPSEATTGQKCQPQDEDDDLMAAVFQKIKLPEVRFVQSPVAVILPSPPPYSTPAPPNSARSELAAGIDGEASPARLESLAGEDDVDGKETPRNGHSEEGGGGQLQLNHEANGEEMTAGIEFEGEEEEEEPSMHLLAHRNSLAAGRGWNQAAETEDGETPRGTTTTTMESPSSIGECCLDDSVASMAATFGETPRKIDEVGEGEEAEDELEEEEFDEEERRSGMSHQMTNSAMENALQNCSESVKSAVGSDDAGIGSVEDEEEGQATTTNGMPPAPPLRAARHNPPPPLLLELADKRTGAGHRLSQLSGHSSSSALSGQSSPASRDVHVRTSLNDPASPFLPSSTLVSPFEPEKQELIRREIGSTGPEGIRRMVDRFQSGKMAKDEEAEENDDGEEGESTRRKGAILCRQKSAHFLLEKNQQEPKEQENRPKRKNTPHPFLHSTQQEEEEDIQVVVECQRPVADILNQFQQRAYSHANGKTSPLANDGGQMHRQSSLENGLNGHTMGGGASPCSIWATNGGKNLSLSREPPAGSLAAIRKSLGSVPSTPTSPGAPPPMLAKSPTANGELKSGQTTPTGVHGKDGVMPKNVSQFYRLWGSAQAQSVGNGQPVAKIVKGQAVVAANEQH